MRFKSIRTKLIVSIGVLTLLLVLALQATNIILVQNAFSTLVPTSMDASLQNAHMQLRAKLDANFSSLETIANMPYIQDTSVPLEERAQSLASFVEKNTERGYQACAVTDTEGVAVLSSGFEIDVAVDDYFQQAIQGQNVVSDPFVSRATGNLLIVYAVPYYDANGQIAGVITLDVDALHLSQDFTVRGLGQTGVAFAIAQNGTTVASTDIETVSSQLNDFEEVKTDATLEGLVESEKKMIEGRAGNSEHVYLGTRELIYYMPVEGTSWSVAVTQSRAEAYQTVNTITYSGIGALVLVVALSVLAGTFLARSIATPLRKLAAAADGLAEGDIEVTLDIDNQDETGVVAKAFGGMTDSIRQQAEVIDKIAQGDYTTGLPVRSDKDVMNKAINRMVDSNNHLMGEIRDAAEQVATGAAQIADGASALATGSTQQAATMEEFSASISEVHSQADATTELARSTVAEMDRASRLMGESLTSMEEMTTAMGAIEASSQEIAKVIKVIDDIAFQTNILALNAAVEAARAGMHGKGFAVVADEVRNLAGKSADAAKETAQLIESSIQSVAEGVSIAGKTSEGLSQVGEIAGQNAEAMGKVSTASDQQTIAIQEINQGIGQISNVVQANSATAEESAASAQELSAQSVLLNRIVDRFKLRGLPESQAPAAPQLPQAHDEYTLPPHDPSDVLF